MTDVLGATATLIGPAGRAVSHCSTPCSFNDLAPKRYSLQVAKEGYRPVQTASTCTPSTVARWLIVIFVCAIARWPLTSTLVAPRK